MGNNSSTDKIENIPGITTLDNDIKDDIPLPSSSIPKMLRINSSITVLGPKDKIFVLIRNGVPISFSLNNQDLVKTMKMLVDTVLRDELLKGNKTYSYGHENKSIAIDRVENMLLFTYNEEIENFKIEEVPHYRSIFYSIKNKK